MNTLDHTVTFFYNDGYDGFLKNLFNYHTVIISCIVNNVRLAKRKLLQLKSLNLTRFLEQDRIQNITLVL